MRKKKEEAPSGGFGGFGVEEKKEEVPSGGFGIEEKKEEAPSGGFTLGEAKPLEEPSSAKGKEGGFGFEFEVEKKEPGEGGYPCKSMGREETVVFSIGAPSASGGANRLPRPRKRLRLRRLCSRV